MMEFSRLQRLCKLETGSEPAGATDPIYTDWLKTKRPFTREELVGSYLMKLGELCGGYLIYFNADGTVTERNMFKPEKSWTCNWSLDQDGIVHLCCPAENDRKEPVKCSLDIVANVEGTVHAGCEDTDESDNDVIEHFKVLYLGPAVMLPGMLQAASAS